MVNSGALAADALAADPIASHFGWGRAEILGLCAHAEHIRAVVDGF
jgi:hypothetical protein